MNIVAHNLVAMNTQRQLKINSNSKAKSTEKLSSGYKINRAADDAAGLSISEKMRRQIRGLTQGVRNTQDGISLCQVADGALAEVHDMLHRMTELSVKAANGTLTDVDRGYIDMEIQQIKTEIDRISETTKFNDMLLFDGSLTSTGSTSTGNTTSGSTISFPTGTATKVDSTYLSGLTGTVVNGVTHYTLSEGTYEIDSSLTNIVLEFSGDTVIQNSTLTNVSLSSQSGSHLYIKNLSITNDSAFLYSGINFNGTNNVLTFSGTNTITASKGAAVNVSAGESLTIEGDGTLNATSTMGAGIGGTFENDSYTDTTGHDYGTIVINSGTVNATSASGAGIGSSLCPVANSSGNITINGGTINAHANVGAGIGAGWIRDTQYNAQYAQGNAGTITINGGNITAYSVDAGAGIGGSVGFGGADVKITGGTIYAYSEYTPCEGAGIGCGAFYPNSTFDPANYDFSNFPVNFGTLEITGGTVTALGGEANDIGAAHPFGIGSFDDTTATTQIMQDYVATYNNNVIIEGKVISPSEMLTTTENGRYAYHYTSSTSSTGGPTTTVLGDIWIQSGTELNDGLYITIGKMNTTVLGLNSVNCKSMNAASHSIESVKQALTKLDTQRSNIGSQQNRLEHIILNEDNIIENTTAAESRIRDTDMATEMVKYSNYNILHQAIQSMLAQANQNNQGILNLLQ